ncbi:MAG: glycosyltransferase [Isosphaerales bacterium]
MSKARKADVVVVADGSTLTTLRCLESVLDHSGPALGRLIVVAGSPPDGELLPSLEAMAKDDSRVHLLRYVGGHGDVAAYNRGLAERQADAVLLACDSETSPGWLDELAAVAYSGVRTACAAPLTIHDVYGWGHSHDPANPVGLLDAPTVHAACAGLPRFTAIPIPASVCCYLCGHVIDAVGLLDPIYRSPFTATADWVMRAQALGFVAYRANHVFVGPLTPDQSRPESADAIEESQTLLCGRHPQLQPQLVQFQSTLDRSLASHAIRPRATGKLRVACDLRSIPFELVGTRVYAVSLVRALSQLPGLDLTLLVRDPAQARGLDGRVVTPEKWQDDVELIHRPAQVIDPEDLRLLYESSAHLIVSYQDLIGYRIPLAFPSDAQFQDYRATSCLSLQAVQRIVAFSESTAREIVDEFGVPAEDVSVVPHGVDAAGFSSRGPRDPEVLRKLGLPDCYFFSVATDFPHKNLPRLLEAYAQFRDRWTGGAPPGLVLAGYASNARGGFYQRLGSKSPADGCVMLGPVSADQLRILYQHALALVFPSLYEGFGLPPLEAMAAGTLVIAMPFTSVAEVGGDSVFYSQGLSADALALAMQRLASDPHLREGLRGRGLARVKQFSWERTARETLEVYRSVVFQPSARSLAMRRRLREAILNWSDPAGQRPVAPPGIRIAWKALGGALHRRLRREMSGFVRPSRRRSA